MCLVVTHRETTSGRNGLEVWKAAAHMPKKLPWTSNNRWSFSWTFRQEADNSTPSNEVACYGMLHRASDIRGGGRDCINLQQDRGKWWAVVNTVMNLAVLYSAGNFLKIRNNNNSIQFNSSLLMCRINSQMANYTNSTTYKHKEQRTIYKTKMKQTTKTNK
jgi:hypothetical protein